MQTQMDVYGLTDPGRRRSTNQDHYLLADLNKSLRVHNTSLKLDDETRIYGDSQGKLLIVADGMGGEPEGERASTIAVDQLATYVLNSLSWCFRRIPAHYTTIAEDLASFGYFVAGVTPTGSSQVVFADGRIESGREFNPDTAGPAVAQEYVQTWTGDASFALDQLESDAKFAGHVQRDKVGIFRPLLWRNASKINGRNTAAVEFQFSGGHHNIG